MELRELPNRRVEAWKYSDLRAALTGIDLPRERASALGERTGVIERLASAQGNYAVETVGAGEVRTAIEGLHEPAPLHALAREFHVASGASLTRVVLQTGAGVTLNRVHIRLGAGAMFRQFTLAEGGKLARLETHVAVEGEGASVELGGVYLAGAGRHADLTSVITHEAVGGETRQLIKGAARKGGRGVFQGRIEVARGAQKTDARQHHHGLMLEDGAEIYAKPELQIYADDVQCAHGNTIGALDDQALFYMRQRGIPGEQAQAMLTEAFLLDAVPAWLPEGVQAEVNERISVWLEAGQ